MENIKGKKIVVDADFVIEVDDYNWIVWQRKMVERIDKKTRKKTGDVGYEWKQMFFCSTLERALQRILHLKTASGLHTEALSDYFSWLDSTISQLRSAVSRPVLKPDEVSL